MVIKEKKYIIVFGNLLSYSKVISTLLNRYGIDAISIDSTKEPRVTPYFIAPFKLENTSVEYLVQHSSLVISLGPTALHELGRLTSIKEFLIKRKKIAVITQGSDITEFIDSPSMYGLLYRFLLRRSVFNLLCPYKATVSKFLNHSITNMFWSRLPHALPDFSRKSKHNKKKRLQFFHPSNLDWAHTDNKSGRNSTKGNDRFLRAFKKAIDHGIKVHCHILDRGPDRLLARKFIEENNLQLFFTWHNDMNRKELYALMRESDIIVDQFDVGGLGGIACEAMAQRKPVMIYMDKNCWPLVYREEPPVINCHTEDEIYQAILKWSDRKTLQELGENAEKWIRKYHDIHTADFSEFILRVCLAAGLEWPRKDLARPRN